MGSQVADVIQPQKCEILRVTNKVKHVINSSYSLHGTDLHFTNNAKYLGVTINSKLKWKPHIDIMCKKANSTRGCIQRNLHGCPRRAKEQAYVTYVRPILEYTSSVWIHIIRTKSIRSKWFSVELQGS